MIMRLPQFPRTILWILLISVVALSCSRLPKDESAFLRAEEMGSSTAYTRFAESYPRSPLAVEARQRATELEEKEALALLDGVLDATKASTLERFIREHPGTRAEILARIRIAEIDFHDLATNNPFRPSRNENSSWQGYLAKYGFGNYIPVPEDAAMREKYYQQLHPLLLQALEKLGSFKYWLGYLFTYPKSPYFDEASRKVEEALVAQAGSWDGYEQFQTYAKFYERELGKRPPNYDTLNERFRNQLARTVIQNNNNEQYQRYLETFPQSPHRREIRVALAHNEFNQALMQENRDRLSQLIDEFQDVEVPQARQDVERARKKIEQIDFDAAMRKGTAESLGAFRQQYAGRDIAGLLPEIERKLESIRLEMLSTVREQETPEAYASFLDAFPNAPEAGEVGRFLERANYNEAAASGKIEPMQKFLADYPDSSFRQRAEAYIQKVEFQQAAERAKSEPTTAPLAAYLKRYPRGAYTEDAQRLMNDITIHYQDYISRYQSARESGNYRRFGEWLRTAPDNYYVAARGPRDLTALRREQTVEQLVADVTSTPAQQGLRPVFTSIAGLLEERSRAVVGVSNGQESSTGFVFNRDGLVLVNARLARGLGSAPLEVRRADTKMAADVVRVAPASAPDVAVLKVNTTIEPIPLGNPAALRKGESVTCLAARDGNVVSATGNFVELKSADNTEWMVIKSSDMPADQLGGVILNRRALAVGLLVPGSQVGPSVRMAGKEYVYAISMRSALDLIKAAIIQATN